MSMARGWRFGSYEVAALIGVGGMGEVYRATDTALKRDVAQIYGLERSDGRSAIVMELVEGTTLAERIAQGRLPPNEALQVAAATAIRRASSSCRTGSRISSGACPRTDGRQPARLRYDPGAPWISPVSSNASMSNGASAAALKRDGATAV